MYIVRKFDPWNNPLCTCPTKYTLNPITGCGHSCKYCYITSYIKDAFNPRFKENLLRKVKSDLKKISRGSVIAISYSSDPYSPPENVYGYMREILKLLRIFDMKVLIATKSDLVCRDVDILNSFSSVVSFTLTTLYDDLAILIEEKAPPPKLRLKAIETLIEYGIPVSLRIDPIIPYLTDDFSMVREIVEIAESLGVRHIVSSIYKVKPDSMKRLTSIFPDLANKWKKLYYREGIYKFGYRYASLKYRKKVLEKICEIVKKCSSLMGFTVCREEFMNLNSEGTYCDASHLLYSPR